MSAPVKKSRAPRAKHQIQVIRITNPFDPRQHVRESVTWRRKATVADYFGGPTAHEVVVSVSGRIVPPEQYGVTYLDKTDEVVICPVPTGGDSGKAILRIVAIIAIAAFAQWAAPWLTGSFGVLAGVSEAIVVAGITMAGSMLVNSMLAPPKPKMESTSTTSSYGVDGAKNTSVEGIPVPVCYGTFRTGGNIIGLYTENGADDNQTLYMLLNAGEGPVAFLSDIEINDQPVGDYKDVEVQTRLGHADQAPIGWFTDSVAAQNKSQKLTLDWSYHTTTGVVDRLRLDVVATGGLCKINKKNGKAERYSVDMEFEYRKVGATNWTRLPVMGEIADWQRATGTPKGPIGSVIDEVSQRAYTQDVNGLITYVDSGSFDWNNDLGQPITDPAQLDYLQYTTPDRDGTARVPMFIDEVRITAAKKSTVRRSYSSARLPTDKYEVRYRRITPESDLDEVLDELYMADVNEITIDTVSYANTALVAVKIRMTDQLSGLPRVTYLNGGRIIDVYGTPPVGTQEQWYTAPSQNPAWIVWDILTHRRYGGETPTSRLDFEAFREWAAHCDAKGLTWNGPMDVESTVWDAAQMVLRVGHAQLVNRGTRWGVVIERADTPVMMFSVANMVEGSYKETWLSLADRANEIDVTFFDKTDSYKQRTLKVMDPAALAGGKKQRSSAITLYGVTDRETAYKEAQLQLNLNRYILKTVEFSAPLEAIACTVGNLVYVQHDMTNWAVSGRFAAGSTASVMKLDRDVVMAAGKQYKLMIHRDTVQRAQGSILSVAGTSLILSGYTGEAAVKRIVVAGRDLRVAGTFDSGNGYGVIVDDVTGLAPGQTYQLWDTDVIEEHNVLNVPGTTDTITLQAPAATGAPGQFVVWMFGETDKLKKPFRIKSISGTSEYRRDIVAVQYDAAVYDFNRYGSNVPVVPPEQGAIGPARGLTLYEESYVANGQVETRLVASWQTPAAGLYAGADVHVSTDGGEAVLQPEARGRTSAIIEAKRGEAVVVRVVAYDVFGKRSAFDIAPTASYTVLGDVQQLDPGTVTTPAFAWSGRDCRINWAYDATTAAYEFGSSPSSAAGALDPHFKDYEVRVLSAAGVPRRTEYTVESTYTYDFGKNTVDGLARSLQFEVRMRTKDGKLGAPALLTATNPAPTIASTATRVTFDSAVISVQHSGDTDYAGVKVWVSQDQTLVEAMDPSVLIYQGPDTAVLAQGLMFNAAHYYRVAAYDAFGELGMVPTATLTFTTSNLDVNAIADDVLADSKLLPALRQRIDLIDADATVAGSVDARIETLRQEVAANDTTQLQAQITAINDVSATTTSANALTLHQLKAQVNDAVTGLPIAHSSIAALNDVSATSTSTAAQSIYQLQSRLNNIGGITLEQKFSTQADINSGLSGQYTLKLDSNGYVAGFGLASTTSAAGETTSEFIIYADKFAVIMPGHDGLQPFTVGVVGGVPRVILSSALIGDAMIQSAHIGDASINTLKLAGAAVTVPIVARSMAITKGVGKNVWKTIIKGYIKLDEPGIVYAHGVFSQRYGRGIRYWSMRIKINGVLGSTIGGESVTVAPVIAMSTGLPAGTYPVEIEWWGENDGVYIESAELFIQGAKR